MADDSDRVRGSGWFSSPNEIFALDHAHDILVSVYLLRRAGPDGSSWPSIATISAATKMSRASVKRALGRLAARGWIEVERRTDAKGDPTSSLYTWRGSGFDRLGVAGVGSEGTDLGSGRTEGSVQGEPRSTTYLEGPTSLALGIVSGIRSPDATPYPRHVSDVKAAVDAFRKIPGVRPGSKDGGVIAGLVGRYGAEALLRVFEAEAPSIGAADNPLMFLASRFRGSKTNGAAGRSLEDVARDHSAGLRRMGFR